jgi:hypothetical protein
MAFLNIRIGLFISATLLWLNLPVLRATAQTVMPTNTQQLFAQSDIDQEGSSPTYVNDPPPPGNKPLPPERLRQEAEPLPADFRVSALQPDFTGDLWVGSWLGLAKINPNTGRLLARLVYPTIRLCFSTGSGLVGGFGWNYEGLLTRVRTAVATSDCTEFTCPQIECCLY